MLELNKIYNMDCVEGLKQLPDNSINCCVTSPPYWGLRDYGVEGQFGLEKTPEEYVAKMVEVFREVKRVLRKDGTLWLNMGDCYASKPPGCSGVSYSSGLHGAQGDTKYRETLTKSVGTKRNTVVGNLKPKDLVGIPWMVAFALRADGWYLRQDIIWHKPNPMPESVTDRCTKAHEYIFLLTKNRKYFYDREAIREDPKPGNDGTIRAIARDRSGPVDIGNGAHIAERVYKEVKGANKRSVWTVATKPFKEAHFAVFPPALIEPCILAGCPENGIVLDPFMGSGTTGMVAAIHQRNFIGFELNPEYCKMAEKRIEETKAQIRMII
jgi:DNA modification methylase